MRKLLSANLVRLWKSKAFWTLDCACFIFGIIFYVINIKNIREDWVIYNANSYFYFFVMYIGIVLAIFSSLFIGTEYSDGTIRNKISVGHSRRDIYLANLLVICVAGLLFCLTHIVADLVLVLVLFGSEVIPVISFSVWRFAGCVLIVAANSAIFTAFAMLDSSKARTSIISLLLAMALCIGGMYIYNKLQEPELTSRMVMQEDGSYQLQENIPNSRYISGTERAIYEWIDVTLPSSQAFRIAYRKGEFDSRMPGCSAGLTILLTIGGIALFKKKDIR